MMTETPTSAQNETLRTFLREELNEISTMLELYREKMDEQNARGIKAWWRRLRGGINQDDFRSLEVNYKDMSRRLDELSDEDVRLFLLRREIGTLKEDVSALGGRQSWRIPTRAWILIAVLPILIYFATLVFLQGQNQDGISTSATMTASALPTRIPSPTGTPTPLPTVIP